MTRDKTPSLPDFVTTGATGALLEAMDWGSTSIGPMQAWPQSLKTTVSLLLHSPVPIVLLWGEDGVMIYNDAYSVFAGERHPQLFGSKVREGWPEVADFNDNVMKVGLAGGTLAYRDQELTLYRHGVPESVWMNLDYSPVYDETGNPGGVIAVVNETTDRVTAERRLASSEEQLRLATEVAEIGLWDVDMVTDTVYWSARVKAMFGLPPDATVTMADFFAGLHPDDREASTAAINAAVNPRDRAMYDMEYRAIGRTDGVVRWVAAKGRGVFDEHGVCVRMLGMAIDISQRKEDEARLRHLNETLEQRVADALASRKLLADIVQGTDTIILVLDLDYRCLAINSACRDELASAFGIHLDVGGNLLELLADQPVHRAAVAALWGRALRGEAFVEVAEFGDAKLRRRSYEMRFNVLLDRDGKRVGAYQFVHDVTERLRDQARLREAEAALLQSQKMEAIGQLTGGIAHDFNNLLQGIAGSLDLISRRPADPARVRRWAEAGLQAADRGTRLTGQLLAFSRAQRMERQPLSPAALVERMRPLLASTLGPAIVIKLDIEGADVAVLCDATQLEMAILNLAINARDAMPQGGELTIRTRQRRIYDDPELAEGDYFELSLIDTGQGMSPEVMNRAFDPFFTTKGVGKGTGLGLSQVYAIARQTEGIARIESREGAGTKVYLLLPTTREAIAETPAPTSREDGDSGPAASILIVDDDADVRSFLNESLTALGYRVVIAEDGAAGLNALDAASPDLVVLDFAMPGMNGAEVARKVHEVRPDLPIIFASGYSDTAAIESAAGPDALVLRKPFRIEEFNKAVARALRRTAVS